MKTRYFLFLFFLLLGYKGYGEGNNWVGFETDSIVSPLDGYVNRFHYYRSTSSTLQPLVISIHQWSTNYHHYQNSMAQQTQDKNWNFIFPDIRGANNHPKACGSDYVISDIDQTIDWAISHLPVDTSRIYMVGASGGGYNALCHLMKSKRSVHLYSIWVPITDLGRWYYESLTRNSKYATDIIKCICPETEIFSIENAQKRSPLFWHTPVKRLKKTRLCLYAGIHDGYTGAVPVIHTLAFYNKLLKEIAAPENCFIPACDIDWILTTRTSPQTDEQGELGGRKILYHRRYGPVSVLLFEGGHEILVNTVLSSNTINKP